MLIKKSSAKNRQGFLVFLLWNVVRFFSLFTQGLNKMESREGLKEMFCNFGEKHIRFPPQAGNIMLLKFLTYAYCVASWHEGFVGTNSLSALSQKFSRILESCPFLALLAVWNRWQSLRAQFFQVFHGLTRTKTSPRFCIFLVPVALKTRNA